MAKLKATRSAQYLLHGEFTFNLTDTMVDTAGVENSLAVVGTKNYEIGNLPNNATIVGGSVTVETVSNDATTATVAVGDSGSAARYLGATNLKAAANTALVPTGYRGVGENLRIQIANGTGGATTGKVTVRYAYVIANRAHEAQPV